MIVSGYSMDLYCDCSMCAECTLSVWLRTERTGFAIYKGNNFREAVSAAKRRGWTFKQNNTRCFAPGHEVQE